MTVTLVVRATAASAQDNQFDASTQVFSLGVLSTEGATRALEAWRPTIDFLNREAAYLETPYRFVMSPQSHESLSQGVADGSLDLALTNPAHFVAAEVESGVRAVLSQARIWQGRTYSEIGATIFVRADSPMRRISDMQGARVMAVAENDFSGWWLAAQEFRRHRTEPGALLGELIFSGGNQREVIYAVQSGLVDAGVVPAGVLEQLAAEGAIRLDDFAPVSAADHPGYPFWVSTPLYPEWVLAAQPNVPEGALALIINSFLNIDAGSVESRNAGNVVWQAPQNYQTVHDLLISLRVRPYENYLMQAAGRIYRTYRWAIIGVVSAIILSLLFLILQLRRNIMLAEERKNILDSEIRSKIFYRSAVEEHTVFCMINLEGRISHVNESFCKTTARARADLLNMPLADLLDEREQEILHDDIMKAMQVGAPWDGPLKILREDGSAAWAQCTVIPVSGAGNELSEIALVATDMTQTRKGISDSRFHDSLELIEDQVVVMRPNTLEMLYCNKAARERLIRQRMGGEWMGKKVKDFITESDMHALDLRCKALVEGPQRRVTWEVTAKNGTPYEISLEYVQPENDEPRFIAIYRDITQRKVAEKAKNEFVATVSHELRTPLTSMKGALGLALSGAIGEMPEQMNKMISMASNNCDRLVMLINDILDMEKIEAGKMDFKMEPLDLTEVIDKALEANKFYAEKFGVTLRLNVDEDPDGFSFMGDKNRMAQVMDNLLSNASKFSEKGSEVIVALRIHRGRMRLSIRDFGCGIPKSAHATIFDKFTQADMGDTRSQGGTGLGLSIAKLIVESHEGAIFFASQEEVGTEFFVDLPRLINEEIVPLTPFDEAEDVAFSGMGLDADQHAAQPAASGSADLRLLLSQLQSAGFEAEIESGTVSVSQVVSGKGVVGQSTVFNWLSDTGRALVTDLLERKKIGNLNVAVIQANATEPSMSDALMLNGLKANMASNWLGQSPGLGHRDALRMLSIGTSDMPSLSIDGADLTQVQDVAQALVMVDDSPYEAILHFDKIGLAHCLMLVPTLEGDLPSDLPIVLMVTQVEAPEAERGVVSKFARPSGAGRGKARRRARG
ncbi:PhnD/SsuA/transferrin family substrate-binding protein [Cognatishimia sp. SS12]|nr:PhnD/SsuA/transferrin family substrate-binding protein [Cognatishimia sp. SS12]